MCVCVSMGMDVHVSVKVRRPHTLVYTLFETGSLLFILLYAQVAAQELPAILSDSDYQVGLQRGYRKSCCCVQCLCGSGDPNIAYPG